jgi:hypothetical protein
MAKEEKMIHKTSGAGKEDESKGQAKPLSPANRLDSIDISLSLSLSLFCSETNLKNAKSYSEYNELIREKKQRFVRLGRGKARKRPMRKCILVKMKTQK